MSKFDDKVAQYKEEMSGKLGMKRVDMALLTAVTKACGPAIYRADAEKVSSSDKKELETVKKNFLMKKLGLEDGPKLDKAIDEAVEKFGKGNRNKYRAIFYYMLVKSLKQSKQFV